MWPYLFLLHWVPLGPCQIGPISPIHRLGFPTSRPLLSLQLSPERLLLPSLQVQIISFLQGPDLAAAAAAKSLQSCPTLCDPIDGSPPGSPVPGILQARTLECVAISFSNAGKWKVKVKSLSRVRFSDPMDCSPPGSSVHGFSRQEYWSGVPLPSPT